jgi:hypothetical protein
MEVTMADGFDASHVPGVIDPPARRDLKDSTSIRVAEIVMAPLMVLVGGTMALAAMVLSGVWVVACRWIRPLLYTVAGIALVAVVLLVGGVMGYAYHAYQAANGKLVATAGPSEMPLGAAEPGPTPALPAQPQTPGQAPTEAPQTDPFGLKR